MVEFPMFALVYAIQVCRIFSKTSKTNEGRVGMYIKDTLKFIKKPDLEITLDGVKTCFKELPRVKFNHVIVGCIYGHPHSNRKDASKT